MQNTKILENIRLFSLFCLFIFFTFSLFTFQSPNHQITKSSISFSTPCYAAEKQSSASPKTQYILGGWGVLDNPSWTSYNVMLNKVLEQIAKKLNVRFKLETYENIDDIIKGLKDKRIDISLLTLFDYLYAKSKGAKIKPFLSYNVKSSIDNSYCIYVRKDADVKSLKDLQNKPFAAPWLRGEWVFIRMLLQKEGIDLPVDKFFSKLVSIPEPVSASYSLITTGIDGFGTTDDMFMIVFISVPTSKKKVAKLICTEPLTTGVFVAQADTNKEFLERFKNIAINVHKDPDFKDYKSLWTMLKGRFILPADETNYEKFNSILENAQKNGWIKEYNDWLAKNPPPTLKKQEAGGKK